MYGKNILIIPTHEDVFGEQAKTEAQIIDGLKEFSSLTILHLCTKLMLFLNSSGAKTPAKQTELAQGLLNQETRERLQAFIENSDEKDPNILIFHHCPVMMMVKLNLEHNNTDGLEITTEETRTKFASLLISLCDIWLYNDRLKGGGSKQQRNFFLEGFRAYQARQFLQENDGEPMINLLTRGRYIVDKVRADTRLTFDESFKTATGMELTLYMDILLMLTAQWTINVDTTKLDDISVRSTEEYFKHTTLSAEDINKFLDIVGFKMDDYTTLNQRYLEMIGMPDDDHLVNFITFMKKPILRYDNKFLCLSPNFLLLQLTEGPYNIVREAIKGTKQEQLLPVVWGDTYEQYALERLAATFPKSTHQKLKDKNNSETIDALIDLDDVVLLTEIKYPHWSFRARITGKREDMHGYMERIARYKPKKEKLGQPKVDKKKGLGQIKYFVEKVADDTAVAPVDLTKKLLVPLLIVGEEYPVDPINRQLLEGYAASEGCLITKDSRVLPFVLITSEELELIESLVEGIGLEETKKLFMTYVMRLHPDHREPEYHKRATSFKNEVFNRKIKVPNNMFMKTQSKAAFEPVRAYFKNKSDLPL
ncbi:MAG: hypothetical protein V4702_03100 [Patescibacteria group bacterium]